MAKVSSELLEEAFIKPIRFALLVDDKFPTFTALATDGGFDPTLDNNRARALFELCRGRGWLCDVGNRPAVAEKFENDNHLHQSDLLILDYNLDPVDQDDPTAALGIIQKLASSDHFNLVIVYTESQPRSVTRDIAYSLGAGADLSTEVADAAKDIMADLDPEVAAELGEQFSQAIIDDYLAGSGLRVSSEPFRKILLREKVAPKDIPAVLTLWTRQRLEARLKPVIVSERRPDRTVVTSLTSAESPHWVTRDNVFVAIVNKADDAPEVLIDRLATAIEAWDPNPLLVMMMQARASLEKAGTLADHKVLETSRLRAGWLLRVLLGKNADERRANVADLYGRLFERLATSVEPSIVDFGARLIEPNSREEAVETAKTMADAAQNMQPMQVYHALNEYLCSDECRDGGMTTGVVFSGMRGGKEQFWVCVTPACDLVEGQNERGWDGELKPTRPVAVARLKATKSGAAVSRLLEAATIGRHIYLFVDNVPVALEALDETSRQMSLETLFLRNGGLIENGKFFGHVIDLDEQRKPVANEIEFKVLAKLRPDYANRLLTQSGSQRARIGVDFFNLPSAAE
ncbi:MULTISPECIES: response regulator receiver domain [Sphingomonas]|uniref:Response regulator receiver domain n=1 Tax=Sphingomonas molluscorum TaxID=418184 RepID=A0ABU8Q3T9_9SPHN|nr:response regulator receiver domain [Sphingomonas sp. JUb134]MBM7405093.1 hypothetical protein [Sphingomonas sp. JUb134]